MTDAAIRREQSKQKGKAETAKKNKGVRTMKQKPKGPQRIIITEENGKLKAKSVSISFEEWCKDMEAETKGMRVDPETGDLIEPDY